MTPPEADFVCAYAHIPAKTRRRRFRQCARASRRLLMGLQMDTDGVYASISAARRALEHEMTLLLLQDYPPPTPEEMVPILRKTQLDIYQNLVDVQ